MKSSSLFASADELLHGAQPAYSIGCRFSTDASSGRSGTQRLVYENIFSGALGQKIAGIRRQAGERVLAEFFRDKDEYPLGTAPEGRELFVVQKCRRHVGIVRSDFQVGAKASVVNPHMAMSVEGNARARIEIAVLHDLVLRTQVGKDGVGQRSR